MKVCGKVLLKLFLSVGLLLPTVASAIYNLSPFYIKSGEYLTYKIIGKTTTFLYTTFKEISNGQTPASGATDGAFNKPTGIAIDTTGDLMYVADTSNHRVIKMVLSTGAFVGAIGKATATSGTCTVASAQANWCTGGTFATGTAAGSFAAPSGIAIDVSNDKLYVSEANNHRVQRFKLSTGAYEATIGRSTVAGGTCFAGGQASWCTGGTFASGSLDGEFNSPKDLAVDTYHGHLFVLDVGNYRVQRFISSTGEVAGSLGKASTGTCTVGTGWCTGGTFSAGTADGMFSIPRAMAVDSAGNGLYVTDSDGSSSARVQKFELASGQFSGAIGYGSAVVGTCKVGKQDGWCAGGSFGTGSADGVFAIPQALAIDKARDRLYISDTSSTVDRIQKFVLSTGAYVGSIGKGTSASGSCVVGLQRKWCYSGAATLGAGTDVGMFDEPVRMTVDSTNKKLIVVDSNNHRVQQVSF